MVAHTASIDHGQVLLPRRVPAAVVTLLALVAGLAVGPTSMANADTPTGLDPTFGVGGKAAIPESSIGNNLVFGSATDAQGRTTVLVHGGQEGLYRFTAGGLLDTSFGADGFVDFPDGFTAELRVAVGAQGVVVPGSFTSGSAVEPAVLRLKDDGSPDTTAGDGGVVALDPGDLGAAAASFSAALAPDGSVYAVVNHNSVDHYFIEHRLADGTPDPSFGSRGSARIAAPTGENAYIFDLLLDHEGRTVFVDSGEATGAHVHRLADDGTTDLSFGDAGEVDLSDSAVTWIAEDGHDGSLILAGSSEGEGLPINDVVRMSSRGQLDRRFGIDGHTSAVPESMGSTGALFVAVLPSGQIGVTSTMGSGGPLAVSVLQPDGSLDGDFGSDGVILDPRHGQLFGGLTVGGSGRLLLTSVGVGSDDLDHGSVWAYTVDQTDPVPHVTDVAPRPGALSVTWSAPADPPFGAIRAYHLMALDADDHIAAQDIVAGDVTTGSLTGLVNGTSYRVVVLPYSTSGPDWASAPATGTPSASGPAITTAAAPTNLTTATGHHHLDVSWTPPTDDGGSPIVGYSLVAVDHATGDLAAWRNVRADLRTASPTGLTDGTTYRVYVIADTAQGFGAPAELDDVTVTQSPAAQPPTTSWTSALPVGSSSAVVSWGPQVEHGQALTHWNVIVIQGGTMTAWKVLDPNQRQTTVPLGATGDAQVYVIPQSANGYGALGDPITVSP